MVFRPFDLLLGAGIFVSYLVFCTFSFDLIVREPKPLTHAFPTVDSKRILLHTKVRTQICPVSVKVVSTL